MSREQFDFRQRDLFGRAVEAQKKSGVDLPPSVTRLEESMDELSPGGFWESLKKIQKDPQTEEFRERARLQLKEIIEARSLFAGGIHNFLENPEPFVDANGQEIILHQYQLEALAGIEEGLRQGNLSGIVQLPTGTGKTIIMGALASIFHRINPNIRMTAVSNRRKINVQNFRTISEMTPRDLQIRKFKKRNGSPDEDAQGGFMEIQTYQGFRHYEENGHSYDIAFYDESHHALGDPFTEKRRSHANTIEIAFSATPDLLSKRGIDRFGTYFYKMDLQEAMDKGYILPPRVYRDQTNIDIGEVIIRGEDFDSTSLEQKLLENDISGKIIESFLATDIHSPEQVKKGQFKKTLVFNSGVESAHQTALRFALNGIPAIALDGTTAKRIQDISFQVFEDGSFNSGKDKDAFAEHLTQVWLAAEIDPQTVKKLVKKIKKGQLPVICSCQLIEEGYDSPAAELGIMADPTQARWKYIQKTGRLYRKDPKNLQKKPAIIDLTFNHDRFRPLTINEIFEIPQYKRGMELTDQPPRVTGKTSTATIKIDPEWEIIDITPLEDYQKLGWKLLSDEQRKEYIDSNPLPDLTAFAGSIGNIDNLSTRYNISAEIQTGEEISLSAYIARAKQFYPENTLQELKKAAWRNYFNESSYQDIVRAIRNAGINLYELALQQHSNIQITAGFGHTDLLGYIRRIKKAFSCTPQEAFEMLKIKVLKQSFLEEKKGGKERYDKFVEEVTKNNMEYFKTSFHDDLQRFAELAEMDTDQLLLFLTKATTVFYHSDKTAIAHLTRDEIEKIYTQNKVRIRNGEELNLKEYFQRIEDIVGIGFPRSENTILWIRNVLNLRPHTIELHPSEREWYYKNNGNYDLSAFASKNGIKTEYLKLNPEYLKATAIIRNGEEMCLGHYISLVAETRGCKRKEALIYLQELPQNENPFDWTNLSAEKKSEYFADNLATDMEAFAQDLDVSTDKLLIDNWLHLLNCVQIKSGEVISFAHYLTRLGATLVQTPDETINKVEELTKIRIMPLWGVLSQEEKREYLINNARLDLATFAKTAGLEIEDLRPDSESIPPFTKINYAAKLQSGDKIMFKDYLRQVRNILFPDYKREGDSDHGDYNAEEYLTPLKKMLSISLSLFEQRQSGRREYFPENARADLESFAQQIGIEPKNLETIRKMTTVFARIQTGENIEFATYLRYARDFWGLPYYEDVRYAYAATLAQLKRFASISLSQREEKLISDRKELENWTPYYGKITT